MEKFTLTETEKARGLSLPQQVLAWWYNLSSKEKLALEIKYDIKPIKTDDQVWQVYQSEHKKTQAMQTTVITSGNLSGDSDGLPNREVVRQAQKNLSMNAKFWILIKDHRIPYKLINGKLVEASYTEAVKGLKSPPAMEIYWLKDMHFEFAKTSAANMTEALKTAEQEKENLDLFKQD